MAETKLQPDTEQTQETQEKENRSHMVTLIIVIVVAVALIFGGGAYLFTRFFTGHVRQASDYTTSTLSAASFTPTVTASGQVVATKSASVVPEVSGSVKSVKVAENDKVTKGQVLMTIKNDSISTAKDSAEKLYKQAQKTLQQAQSSYDKQQSSLEKTQASRDALEKQKKKVLAKDPDADVSSYDTQLDSYDEAITGAKANLATLKASLESAQSNASDLKSSYESALKQYQLLTVKASMAGTVANIKAKQGMTIEALNKEGAAMEIVDLSTLVAQVGVPESSISDVLVGNAATVWSTSSPTKSTSATVSSVGNVTNGSKNDAGENLYTVKLLLKSTKKVKYGMSIEAELKLREYQNAYHVPQSAVSTQDNKSYVKILYDDNSIESHEVTVLGTDDQGNTVITGSLVGSGVKILSDYNE